jgi:hypothetical protein
LQQAGAWGGDTCCCPACSGLAQENVVGLRCGATIAISPKDTPHPLLQPVEGHYLSALCR